MSRAWPLGERVARTAAPLPVLGERINYGALEMNNSIDMMRQSTKEVTTTRDIDAPRDRVFRAWTDPDQVREWWGPEGFTNPVAKVDARPGGGIRIDMRGPDGTIYPMGGEFKEVVDGERLVFTSTAFQSEGGEPQLEALNTVTFEDIGGRTRLTWHEAVTRSTPAVAMAMEGMAEGSKQSIDRLARYLDRR